jgi:tetratricopeptide (TPR) repeat protein
MTWWKKLVGVPDEFEKVDYYAEGLALMDRGRFHEALTSMRLALKDAPGNPSVLQQIAISYSRIGMIDEAAKTYRHVLNKEPDAVGAHYGLAFLLVRAGQEAEAAPHLEAFLNQSPENPESRQFIEHASQTLDEIRGRLEAPEGTRDASSA